MENPAANRGARGASRLLSPDNCALLLIDFQPQMFFGVASMDRQLLLNNVAGLAKAARIFELPVILTTISAESFSGHLVPALQELFPQQEAIDRTSIDAWEDQSFFAAVQKTGRRKLVIAALWSEACLAFPVLSALEAGYEVYPVVDASGGVSETAHQAAVLRMTQAGAMPVTWMQVMLELQRDWAHQATYEAVLQVAEEHGGAYGIGIRYAKEFLGQQKGKERKAA